MNRFDEAAAQLEAAKIAEAQATAARIDAEQRVIALMPTKDEGSITERGLRYKVTVTYGMNRTVDAAAMESVRGAMAPALFDQAVAYKPSLITAGLRYLQLNEPDAYAQLAQAITAKPSKPSVRVEAVQAERQAA